MTDVDKKIREALRREDAELMEHEEPSVHELLIEAFRGRRAWLNGLATVFTFVFVGVATFALYGFFHAEGTQSWIAWASGFLWSSLSVAMLKIWLWMELQRNSVLRELKRLELQVALLSKQLRTEK